MISHEEDMPEQSAPAYVPPDPLTCSYEVRQYQRTREI
jgi:hypothetical protein